MFKISDYLKLLVCIVIFCCVNGLYGADSVSEEIYSILLEKEVIIGSVNGSMMKATLLKNNEAQIVVADDNGKIVVLEKNTVKSISLDKKLLKKSKKLSSEKILSTDHLQEKSRFDDLYEKNNRSGRRISKVGGILFFSGTIVTAVGVFGIAHGYPNRSNKDGANEKILTWKGFGWACVTLGLPLAVTGHVLKGVGNGKIRRAEQYRAQSQGISYRMEPLVDPLTDSYGVSLNFTF